MTIGLLNGRFYQMAYVTNDIDQAMEDFRTSCGIETFFLGRDAEFEIGRDRMARAHVALAWLGGIQIELIEPAGGEDHVYRQILTGSEYQMHYHHEAHVLDTIDDFSATKQKVAGLGYEIVIDAETPGYRYFYADTRRLTGHHTEYFFFSDEALAYFRENVPSY